MARCKVYEIKGPDSKRIAGAERCVNEAASEVAMKVRRFRVCQRHQKDRWRLFVEGGWFYAVDPKSDPTKKRKRKGARSKRGRDGFVIPCRSRRDHAGSRLISSLGWQPYVSCEVWNHLLRAPSMPPARGRSSTSGANCSQQLW